MNKEIKKPEANDGELPLGEKNYKLLAIGFVIILLGFLLMVGGDRATAESFNENIFSWRRITLAPLVLVGGFVFEIYAILKR